MLDPLTRCLRLAKRLAQQTWVAILACLAAVSVWDCATDMTFALHDAPSGRTAQLAWHLAALIAALIAGTALAVRLSNRTWPVLTLAAILITLTSWPQGAGLQEIALLMAATLACLVMAGLTARLLRRFARNLAGRLGPLHAPLSLVAGVGAGLVVLLQPDAARTWSMLIPDAWWFQGAGAVSDLLVAQRYVFGGLALGVVTRCCWEHTAFPRPLLLLSTLIWCGLAARTLLDADGRGMTQLDTTPADPTSLAWLAVVAASCLIGHWVANTTLRWREDA